MKILDDDIELMLSFQKGEKSCFEKILEKYEKPLINFIFRTIGDRWAAEDLTQEVFLRIYRSAATYKPLAKFSTWLYKIAFDLCIDHQRKGKVKTISLNDPINTEEGQIIREIPDLSQITPDTSIEKRQISETVQAAVLSLPANQRLALTLRIYENKSYQEISKILGCSISAVESLLFRARQNLKQKLSFLIGSFSD